MPPDFRVRGASEFALCDQRLLVRKIGGHLKVNGFIESSSPFNCDSLNQLGIGIDDLFSFNRAFEIASQCPAPGLGVGAATYPGFSLAAPLIVDVISSTPDPMNQPLGNIEQAADTRVEEVLGGIPVNGFVSSGGIDFPSARPTDPLGSLISGAFGLAGQLIAENPVQAPGVPTLRVNATACPVTYTPGGKLVHQHLRKQQVKARRSAVTQCVSNRHMNSLNAKALKRATRRLNGFMHHVKTAQRAIHKALGHTVTAPRRQSTRRGCISCGRPARSCVC